MPRLVVRRTGNSLAIPIPSPLVRELEIAPGDEVEIRIQRVPRLLSFAGRLKGRMTADELNRLSNEGEDLG
jgi:antitoxin component of MazEF toxin-antitoxin module